MEVHDDQQLQEDIENMEARRRYLEKDNPLNA
jgi:hypothetical protein